MKSATQQQKVLALLQQNERVNSYDLTYVHSIKQAPTRIKELREKGYTILSQTLPNKSVDYLLEREGSSIHLSKKTPLKIEPERAKLASKRITYYKDSNGIDYAKFL